MARQVLKASASGIQQAKTALTDQGFSRQELAEKVIVDGKKATIGIDIQTVHKFFTQKSLDHRYFVGICKALNLDWREIALNKENADSKSKKYINDSTLDELVENTKELIKRAIQNEMDRINARNLQQKDKTTSSLLKTHEKYDALAQMLDTSKPIGLDGNHINVSLTKISEERKHKNQESNRLSALVALKEYSRLIIIGDSETGKTTFLKYLSIQCDQGQLSISKIPIFISLKNFSDSALIQKSSEEIGSQSILFNYIAQQFSICKVRKPQLKTILNSGRALILIDDLNLVDNKNQSKVFDEIGKFSKQYLHNLIVLTSEITYSNITIQNFTSFELEDFIIPLIAEAKEKNQSHIQQKCGTMRVLDMSQPIELGEIYTNVNILEKITSRRRLGINELMQNLDLNEFDRLGLGKISEKRISGEIAVENHSKLMILGKPGSGKTTFLKYIAIQCNSGIFRRSNIPIFISLKDFAETEDKSELIDYIILHFKKCGLEQSQSKVELLLRKGKALILLDGLDEVRKEDNDRVVREIRQFTDRFHKNYYVMTCRIAAREYTFEKFTEVEVADFDDKQIRTFTHNWFKPKNQHKKEKIFIRKLTQNPPIKELATNPLLLTLLCLVFEETADFPSNRAELYQEGLNVLLKKWDAQRNIERYQAYKNLSIHRKEDLLSQLALTTFERKEYFFKQKDAERYIHEYIFNLPDASNDEQKLQLDSEAILRSIEAQHGLLIERSRHIYSFSHLTFHEYFTARKVTSNRDGLESLANHCFEKNWREVFLLSVSMLQNADELIQLMKSRIDDFLTSNQSLSNLLLDINKKAISTKAPFKVAAVRAFYLDLIYTPSLAFNLYLSLVVELPKARTHARELAVALENSSALKLAPELEIANSIEFDLKLARTRARNLDIDLSQSKKLDIDFIRALALSLFIDLALVIFPQSNKSLKKLKAQKDNLEEDHEALKNWSKTKAQTLLQPSLIQKFSESYQSQSTLLKEFYDANKLLIDCLNSDCYVTRSIRERVIGNLLLPAE